MGDTHTVAEWTEAPYTDHERRDAVVQHRVRMVVYDGGFVDVVHECRGDSEAPVSETWTTLVAYEYRDGRVNRLERGEVLRS